MMRRTIIFSLICFFLSATPIHVMAQLETMQIYRIDSIYVLPDSAQPLPLEDFFALIFANHPIVKQADLLQENARQEIRLARGAFDPKIEANWNVKQFKETEYYNILNSQLKVPVWFPIDPKLSFDQNRGEYLNPERFISDQTDFQQFSAGVSLPVGRGLFIDQRRATMKQAELFVDMADAERVKMINKILLTSAKDYWEWYFAYYDYKLLAQSVEIAQEIFDRVRMDYQFGEAAVIDTVQANITLQNRMIDMQQVQIRFIQTGLRLSNHLWNEELQPVVLSDNMVPIQSENFQLVPDRETLDILREQAENNHPELRKLELKRGQLEIENRLNRENLKPRLDLNYNLINAPISPNGEDAQFLWTDNYKFGLDFSFPLFLRKERAKVAKTEIKIQDTEYSLMMRRREIQNEILAVYTEITNTFTIVQQQLQAVNNYERLLEAELFNLESGESDLFKINFQQDKLIESQSKLLKMQANFQKLKATLYWAAGIPYLNYDLEPETVDEE
ncbi:MAG TPA: transporter [Cytophagales bacterium]|nr:transporter [Cytophagales bacterium]